MDGLDWVSDAAESVLAVLRAGPGQDIAAWFLGLVFIWSGSAKLRKPRLAALAMADFGVVRRTRRWQGLALGAAESSLGVCVLLSVGALPLVGITALLWVFCAVIAKALIAGERFPCLCFGDEASILSSKTLIRALALAILAVVIVSAPQAPTLSVGTLTSTSWLALVVSSSALAVSALLGRVGVLMSSNAEVVEHFRARAEVCQP